MKITSVALILTIAVVGGASFDASAQQPDTSQWKSHRSTEWGFDVSTPRDWVRLDMRVLNARLALRQNLSGGRMLMCLFFAKDETQTTGMSQQEINEKLFPRPFTIQEAQVAFRNAGQPYIVHGTSIERIMNLPAYIYDVSISSQSMDTHFDQYEIMATLYIRGRDFTLDCAASGETESSARELYAQYLGTFRAIFGTFIIEPR